MLEQQRQTKKTAAASLSCRWCVLVSLLLLLLTAPTMDLLLSVPSFCIAHVRKWNRCFGANMSAKKAQARFREKKQRPLTQSPRGGFPITRKAGSRGARSACATRDRLSPDHTT